MKLRWLVVAFVVGCVGVVAAQRGAVSAGIVVSTGSCCAMNGVKDVPFSAEVIQETNQVLADGNRIHQELHGRIYRDSQGRTRDEMQLATLPSGYVHEHISINDPVQQVIIMLEPQSKTAQVHHLRRPEARMPPLAAVPNANSTASQRPPVRITREVSKPEKLGTMELEGFTVTGTRYTYTTPAGQMGNEQPIVSVHETWVASELHEVLLSKLVDPRCGRAHPQAGQHSTRGA